MNTDCVSDLTDACGAHAILFVCSLFNSALSVTQTICIKWKHDKLMINWKGIEWRQPWSNLRYSSSIGLEGLRKITKTQSGQPVSRPRFEPRSSQIRNSSVNHTTMFSPQTALYLQQSKMCC
jgi:hypothetical protein